jgi:hypothetical protein
VKDFEELWRQKIRCQLKDCEADETMQHLADSHIEEPSYSEKLVKIMKAACGEERAVEIMLGAACHYPHLELEDIRSAFQETGDLKVAHSTLQSRFDDFLADILAEKPELQIEIKKRNWGLAGVLTGNTIIATKIPKSGYLEEYFAEQDVEQRRLMYCHCPRIREYLDNSNIDPIYCYCGSGFYQDIWEYITGRQVKIKVNKSILKGDDHCQFELQIANKG